MVLLLKDCGLEGFKGSVQRCADCRRSTVHFQMPGGSPACAMCGAITDAPRQAVSAVGESVRSIHRIIQFPLALGRVAAG